MIPQNRLNNSPDNLFIIHSIRIDRISLGQEACPNPRDNVNRVFLFPKLNFHYCKESCFAVF